MSFTPITPATPVDGSDAVLTSGTELNLTETACDAANGNSFSLTGHEVLILRNSDSADHTVTIYSAADPLGRTSDIQNYTIPANTTAVLSFLGVLGMSGWTQSDGTLHFKASDATIKATVLYVGF